MSPGFHNQPFDEATRTKLDIFEMYTKEWIPVWVAPPQPMISTLHVYDFMAGPGTDSAGTPGSPLRLLEQLRQSRACAGWRKVAVHLHLFDAKRKNIDKLKLKLADEDRTGIQTEVETRRFEEAFPQCVPTLLNPGAAKLVFIDQFGVSAVSDDVFSTLVRSPKCDFVFFISSQALHRFRDHPSIRQKISRPNDPHHVHVAVAQYYKERLPTGVDYYLGRFSLKKTGGNIHGLIFGSGHPLGMQKFLKVAWTADKEGGEANFDIDRDRNSLFGSTKLNAFEEDLEQRILGGSMRTERDIVRLCFEYGVREQHAWPVLKKLKGAGQLSCDFRVPQFKSNRRLTLIP